jgi:ABC-type uncharacterized transport system substrate-binding protein
MRRREFITLLGTTAAAARPLVVRAQHPERMRRLGVLMPFVESDPKARARISAFEEGLQTLGWKNDRNIQIDYRWAGADQSIVRTYAAELIGMKPDVLFAAAVPPLIALHGQTQSIPIVFVQVSDPVKLGLVESLAHPGGNVTGFVNFEHSIGGKWLELLKDTAPGTNRVAIILDPDNTAMTSYLEAIKAAAPSFGMQVTPADVRNPTDIERFLDAFAQQPNDTALIVLPNAVTILNRKLIISLAIRNRLPAVYPYRFFASDGGLMSYGVALADQYRHAAGYVDRILNGGWPGNLPIQEPTKFEFVLNLKTSKALGLNIPPTLLATADEVIE